MATRSSLLLLSVLLLSACTSGVWPISNGASRATPLHYGLYVTPTSPDNPIHPPERFIGYHVGTDFEITPDELDTDVPIFAICDGPAIYSGFAGGYGGLVVQRCTIKNQEVTVLYGHLKIDSLPRKDTVLTKGQQIAVLGAAKSYDTDGNRKHLHLGIHIGDAVDYLGYVQTPEELKQYMDPMSVLPL